MQDESENRAIVFVTPMQLVLIRNIHLRVSSHYQRVVVCVSFTVLSRPASPSGTRDAVIGPNGDESGGNHGL